MLVAISELETGPTDDEAASATLWEMSSDAAKDGTDRPAVAGYMHGASWAISLRPCGVVGSLQLSIPVLEFLAIVINFLVFSPRIPTGVRIVVMTDSLTSVGVLADGTAHAPLIQWLHTRLLADKHFVRLAPLALIRHGYGETNVMSDARSRGYDDLVVRLCAALRIRNVVVDAPDAALEVLDALRADHYALLGVVDGKQPTDDDSSEPTANSTKRRAVDPIGGGVRIGEASNEGPSRGRRRRPPQNGPRHRPTLVAARRHRRRPSALSAANRRWCSPPPSCPPPGGARRVADAAHAAAGTRTVAAAALRRTDRARAWRASCDLSPSKPASPRRRRR